MIDKSLDFLKPYDVEDLIRVGRNEDGGYIISKKVLDNCDFLLSFGMANDWSFELDFLNYSSNKKTHIYDHTVNLTFFLRRFYKSIKRLFYLKSSLTNINLKLKELINFLTINKKKLLHIKKKVDEKIGQDTVNIEQIFSNIKNDKIILKIDIEGDEYKILNDVLNFSDKIELILVEFHSIDLRRNEFLSLIRKIQKNYYIIHLHGNNITGYCEDNLPKTIEFTFLKKKSNNLLKLQKNNNYPIKGLDFPNHPYINDISINFNE